METSAKTGMNVNDIFLAIGKCVCVGIANASKYLFDPY